MIKSNCTHYISKLSNNIFIDIFMYFSYKRQINMYLFMTDVGSKTHLFLIKLYHKLNIKSSKINVVQLFTFIG